MEPRIISLIASGTEIVAALGYGHALVGRSHECDFPEFVQQLPKCSEPRIDVHAGSLEIDRQVKAAVADALSVYRVFSHELERLQPTHVVTQTQCEVCAVSLSDVEAALCNVVGSRPRIVSLEPMDLADIWRDIRSVAESLGDPDSGAALVASLQSRLERLKLRADQLTERPSLVCLEWLAPLMSAGNWTPELAELAGGRPLLCEAGKHSPYFSWDDLLAADPDVIAILPCGFDLPRTISELPLLTEHPEWSNLSAVRSGRVYVADGNQYFNRPGPRLVESAEILFELLHDRTLGDEPSRFHGEGWLRLEECRSA